MKKLWIQCNEKGIPTNPEISALSNLTWDDARKKTAFLLAILTGARIGEIQALRIEDVFDTHIVIKHNWCSMTKTLKCPKNGLSRVAPIPSFLREQLISLYETNPHGDNFIFYGKNKGCPLWQNAITSGFYNALRLIGISDEERKKRNLTFHSCRHYCTSSLRGIITDSSLQELLGHKDLAMTDRYTHITQTSLDLITQGAKQMYTSFYF